MKRTDDRKPFLFADLAGNSWMEGRRSDEQGSRRIMRISEKDTIKGARIVRPIGKIRAVSTCRPVGGAPVSQTWREQMLRDLVRRAEDMDADAIVRLDFHVEAVATDDEVGVPLERICAEGVAVRLAA